MSEFLAELGKLTQASQEQTAASQALSQEVAGKMAQIDNELSQAVAMVSGLSRIFHVDRVDGSDSNDGSSSKPFATLRKAITSVPVNGYADIYVKYGQVHTHDNTSLIAGAFVTIRAWGWAGLESDMPTIHFSSIQNATHNHLTPISLSAGAKLRFSQVKLDHEDKKDPSLPWSNSGSMCYTGDTAGMSSVVSLYKCKINLRSSVHFYLSSISGGDLLAHRSEFTGEGIVMFTNTVGMAGFLSTTFEAGVIPHKGKVFSNVEVSA